MFSQDDDEDYAMPLIPAEQDAHPAWSVFFDNKAQIDAFVQIAELGSFQRAASYLGIGIISLRRMANRIERRQGERLFRRDGDVVRLTGAGERLYAVTRLIPGATRAGRPDDLSGRGVTLAVDEPLTHDLLRRGLMTYLRNTPHARMQMIPITGKYAAEDEADISVQLRDGQPMPDMPRHEVRMLGRLRLVPFMGRRHVARQGALTEALLVHYCGFNQLTSLEAWHALVRGRAGGVIEVASSDLMRECLLWGGGIGLLPHYSHLIDRELVPVPELLPALPPLDVMMSVRHDVMASVDVSAVVNMLEQVYFDRREWLME